MQTAGRMGPTTREDLQPLAALMRKGMAERGYTFRALAAETGLTHPYLSSLARGQERAKPETIAAIARALEVDVEQVAEYQLWAARRMFDERPAPEGVGLEQALANFSEYRAALRSLLEGMADAVPRPAPAASPAGTGTSRRRPRAPRQ